MQGHRLEGVHLGEGMGEVEAVEAHVPAHVHGSAELAHVGGQAQRGGNQPQGQVTQHEKNQQPHHEQRQRHLEAVGRIHQQHVAGIVRGQRQRHGQRE